MSDPTPMPALDLERANFDTPSTGERMRCAFCQRELLSSYFDVNGRPACESCRYGLEQAQKRGAGALGFFKALAAGCGAAIVGFLIYWLIEELTGYELGLIAIVVGVMVGRAVRWGSGHRGGWVYQTMAVGLTYLAITCTYIPLIFKQLREESGKPAAASAGPIAGSDKAGGDLRAAGSAAVDAPAVTGAAAKTAAATPAADSAAAPASEADSTAAPVTASAGAEPTSPMSLGELVMGLGGLVLFAAALPFLAGAKNILGILILGFGVWEAWKVNRRPKLTITGPLRLGDAPAPTTDTSTIAP